MYTYKVKSVVRVVDGDTVDVEIDLGFNLTLLQRVRMKGINAPETRTTDLAEKAKGLVSKRFLECELGEYSELIITTYKDDKYGRMLGEFYKDHSPISINQKMLDLNFAEPFM